MSDACIRRRASTWTKCTCDDCKAWMQRLRKKHEMGAPIAADHQAASAAAWAVMDDLQRLGWTQAAIASATGIPTRAIYTAVLRRSTWSTRNARRILAHAPWPTAGSFSALGSRRRLRALAALGWSLPELADRFDMPAMTLSVIRSGKTVLVHAHVAAQIRDMYDALHMTPGPSGITRRAAEKRGWHAPLAWDQIDEPNEMPRSGRRERGAFDLDDWMHLVRFGEDPTRAAKRFGVTANAIEKAAYRHNRPDVIAALAGARNQERKEAS